ncbi:glycosyltransferase [Mycobacterium ostraviense]|uniref:Glycosyl transferase family 1 n=1 Tax=Mycobacterium ostraviense TaxID=2738409 RepID=A0A163WE92_9MYCO|nr:glycosyltransferase [Mycobacterium ostraviense]KZS58259.1 glycosyl transferase family 1 [Mycobacterium ostraviense]UGT93218.1 glycosyltransferase [Mycobacterium ostraviense]
MRFVLAMWGTRGDVEPCVAIGCELLRRGHDVRMAVAPELVGFAESAGLAAVTYGPDPRRWLDAHRDFCRNLFDNFWRIPDSRRLWREAAESGTWCWGDMSTTLRSLADGADLLLTGMAYQEVAFNVAEYYDIPLATLHFAPLRANGQLQPLLPAPLARAAMTVGEWLVWPMRKKAEEVQRRELGLPKATSPAFRRITERGSLEIQAYDEMCFPGLAAEWAKWNGPINPLRPFVGALTMELPTDADEEVVSWIAAGTPPIYFGFGSIPVESPADTLAMICAACAQLGERALVCSGGTDFSDLPHSEHVKVVGAMNHAAIFPACRAVVHHGGAGTTAAGLRAGVRMLILWRGFDQPYWAAVVKRLKVGTARRFSSASRESLVADLGTILAPQYLVRAREVATRMTTSAASVAAAADAVENCARLRRAGKNGRRSAGWVSAWGSRARS